MDLKMSEQFEAEAERKEQERIADKIIDSQIKVLSALYDKAAAYTQMIIIVGYASFFGIWSFVKDYISGECVLWSALFMGLSIAVFVFFEVCKMTYNSWYFLKKDTHLKEIQSMRDPNQILAAFSAHDKQIQRSTIFWGKIWCWTIFPTVLFAIAGIIIILTSFITGLLTINDSVAVFH